MRAPPSLHDGTAILPTLTPCVCAFTPYSAGWGGDSTNMATIIGSYTWLNISLTVSAMIEPVSSKPAPYIFIGLRAGRGGQGNTAPNSLYASAPDAYVWRVDSAGAWALHNAKTQLANGTLISPFGTNTWHTLSLSASNAVVTGLLDGVVVVNVTDRAPRGSGYAMLGSSVGRAQFDNLVLARAG